MENNKAFTLENGGKKSFFFIAIYDSCQRIISTKKKIKGTFLLHRHYYRVKIVWHGSQYDDIMFDFE